MGAKVSSCRYYTASFFAGVMRYCAAASGFASAIVGAEAIRREALGNEGEPWANVSLRGRNLVQVSDDVGGIIPEVCKRYALPMISLTCLGVNRIFSYVGHRIERSIAPSESSRRHIRNRSQVVPATTEITGNGEKDKQV